jgi:probable phosphoglycerate mutase
MQSPQRLSILRILLIRHGLSEDNLNSIWAGHKDSPLAAAGVLQAKALGGALANYNLSAIYSSDLKRASRTAEEILQVSGFDIPW